jgi:phytoene synthase
VYAFARIADDFADEGDRSDAARLALLDDWRDRLHQAAAGHVPNDGSDAALVFTALGATMQQCALEPSLFEDLLSAFRQDVLVKRYETWEELLDYCRRSANPVGRLVLRIAGYRDSRLDRASDALCTALQLANFWQDLAVDWRKGRLYVPQAIVRASGADPADLDRAHISPAWSRALRDVSSRTRLLFADGRPVADGVRGRLRWELRATWLGGVRVLDRTEAAGFDVFRHRPALDWRDAAVIGWRTIVWRRRDPS